MAATREPRPRGRLLPDVDAEPARRGDEGSDEERRVGQVPIAAGSPASSGTSRRRRTSTSTSVPIRAGPRSRAVRTPQVVAGKVRQRRRSRASATRSPPRRVGAIQASRRTPSTRVSTSGTSSTLAASAASLYTVSQHVAKPTHVPPGGRKPRPHDARASFWSGRRPDRAPDAARAAGRRRRGGGARSRRGLRARRPTDRSAPTPPISASGRAPEQHLLDGLRIADDNGVEVVVPTLHHQIVTASSVGSSPSALARSRLHSSALCSSSRTSIRGHPTAWRSPSAWGLPYFRRHVPDAGRARTCRSTAAPPASRPPARALLGRDSLPERPGRRRCSRRTTSPSCCAATSSSTFSEGATAIFEDAGRRAGDDEHPQRVRRRRLRRRPGPAEADGHRRRGAGGGSDPGRVGALPRLHVDPEGRARTAAHRQLRDARLRRLGPGGYFRAARTCTSRTSSRISRPGT